MRRRLDNDQARLYELIWKRTIASQMESAELERTTVDITAKAGARVLELRATGQVIKFDGFLALYQEGHDDEEDEDSRRLPAMSEGEPLKRQDLAVTQHFTEPPPRFSEASLVKRMEELGIGRPSTYASILQVLEGPRLCEAGEEAAVRRGQGPRRRRVPGKLLQTLCRIRFHRRSGGAARPHLQQRDFLAAGAEGFLAAGSSARSTRSRICASPKCSTCSTRCWARTSIRRARTAAMSGSARPAAPASSI